jgi:hypothetical protein
VLAQKARFFEKRCTEENVFCVHYPHNIMIFICEAKQ